MQQLEAISKLYYEFDNLVGGYVDLEETAAARDTCYEYIESLFAGDKKKIDEIESLIGDVAAGSERQGFIYGFKYAALLLATDGKGAAICAE